MNKKSLPLHHLHISGRRPATGRPTDTTPKIAKTDTETLPTMEEKSEEHVSKVLGDKEGKGEPVINIRNRTVAWLNRVSASEDGPQAIFNIYNFDDVSGTAKMEKFLTLGIKGVSGKKLSEIRKLLSGKNGLSFRQ